MLSSRVFKSLLSCSKPNFSRQFSTSSVNFEKQSINEESKHLLSLSVNDQNFVQIDSLLTIDKLFQHRVHIGHRCNLRNPWMRPFIFGSRVNTDIINLAHTRQMLTKALTFLANIVYNDGIVLFVNLHPQHVIKTELLAKDSNEYAHCREWIDGILFESDKIQNNIVRLPNVLVFLHTLEMFSKQHRAVIEAAKSLIPTIALVDTDTDPSLITYPIAANDDTSCSVQLFCDLFKTCIRQVKLLLAENDKLIKTTA